METLYTCKRTADLYVNRPDFVIDFVFERIESFCAETHTGFDLAVDLCCGWGQIAAPISKFFKQVVAVDISEHQIANAPSDIPNVEFKVGTCYDVPSVPSGAADLVVIGIALHLLDHPRVFKEIERMLKPGGAFIVLTYSLALFNIKEIKEIYNEHHFRILENFPKMQMIEDGYATVTFPYPVIKRYSGESSLHRDYSPEEYIQLLCSIPQSNATDAVNGAFEITDAVKKRIRHICQTQCDPNVEKPIHAVYPVHMVMTQKPKY